MKKKRARLVDHLMKGKTISAMAEANLGYEDPTTTMVSLWLTKENRIAVNIETFFNKHVMCEQLYIRDEVKEFDNIDDAIGWFESETNINFFQMTA